MNTEKIIAKLASEHGVRLNQNDPILATVLLNKIILDDYVESLEIHISESLAEISIKEDNTITKYQTILKKNETKTNQQIEKILFQFADKLESKVRDIKIPLANESQGELNFPYLAISFLLGSIIGGVLVYILV